MGKIPTFFPTCGTIGVAKIDDLNLSAILTRNNSQQIGNTKQSYIYELKSLPNSFKISSESRTDHDSMRYVYSYNQVANVIFL